MVGDTWPKVGLGSAPPITRAGWSGGNNQQNQKVILKSFFGYSYMVTPPVWSVWSVCSPSSCRKKKRCESSSSASLMEEDLGCCEAPVQRAFLAGMRGNIFLHGFFQTMAAQHQEIECPFNTSFFFWLGLVKWVSILTLSNLRMIWRVTPMIWETSIW